MLRFAMLFPYGIQGRASALEYPNRVLCRSLYVRWRLLWYRYATLSCRPREVSFLRASRQVYRLADMDWS